MHILSQSWAGDLVLHVLVATIQPSCPGLHLNDPVSFAGLTSNFFVVVVLVLVLVAPKHLPDHLNLGG